MRGRWRSERIRVEAVRAEDGGWLDIASRYGKAFCVLYQVYSFSVLTESC